MDGSSRDCSRSSTARKTRAADDVGLLQVFADRVVETVRSHRAQVYPSGWTRLLASDNPSIDTLQVQIPNSDWRIRAGVQCSSGPKKRLRNHSWPLPIRRGTIVLRTGNRFRREIGRFFQIFAKLVFLLSYPIEDDVTRGGEVPKKLDLVPRQVFDGSRTFVLGARPMAPDGAPLPPT